MRSPYSSVKLVCKHLTGLNARLSNRKTVGAFEWLKHRTNYELVQKIFQHVKVHTNANTHFAQNVSGWRHLVLWYTDTKQWIYL